jgi:hypothetical protein
VVHVRPIPEHPAHLALLEPEDIAHSPPHLRALQKIENIPE